MSSTIPTKSAESRELVRMVIDPRRATPKEIADAMNVIRAEARRRAGLVDV